MSFSRYSCVSGFPKLRAALATVGLVVLTGCDGSGNFDLKQAFSSKPEDQTSAPSGAAGEEFIEQDVEAPEVFSATEPGLWDGRPSLGGVWVAHPDVKDPERVMIRNASNGKFVVGALFRREREIPGPRLQISSDAAKALDVLAGAPVELEVVALRKERIPIAPPEPEGTDVQDGGVEEPSEIKQSTLDPIAAAGAAIDTAEPQPVAATASAPEVQSTLPVSRLERPYIQVGIFNQEENAERVATQMRKASMSPTVHAQKTGSKDFWRVVVGPATTATEQKSLQDKVKAEGYADAYPVTN